MHIFLCTFFFPPLLFLATVVYVYIYIYSVKSVININRQEVYVSIIICCMFMFYLSSFIFCHCSRICLDIHTVTRRTVSGFDRAH